MMVQSLICKVAFTLLLMTSYSVNASTVDSTQPYDMMQTVSKVTFERLAKEQSLIQQDPNYLKVVVEEELMPYVNDKYAALKLLGPNLKGAKREDVLTFIEAFRGYLVTAYAQALTQYTGQEIVFGKKPMITDKSLIVGIKVIIIDAPRPNINLEFKLRKNKKTSEWKAFDMIVEGISLLSSKQSEWNAKIRQEGVLSVAKELETLAGVDVRFEGGENE